MDFILSFGQTNHVLYQSQMPKPFFDSLLGASCLLSHRISSAILPGVFSEKYRYDKLHSTYSTLEDHTPSLIAIDNPGWLSEEKIAGLKFDKRAEYQKNDSIQNFPLVVTFYSNYMQVFFKNSAGAEL